MSERDPHDVYHEDRDRREVEELAGPTPDPRVLVVTMVGEDGTPGDKMEIRENSWYASPSRAQILLELTHRIDDAFEWLERRGRT